MGKLGQMRFLILRVERLERLAGALEQLHPPRESSALRKGLADQRMPEPQRPARAWHRRQHTSCDRLVGKSSSPSAGTSVNRCKRIERELAAEHRGQREHDHALLGQAPQPPPDHLANALRDPEVRSSRCIDVGDMSIRCEQAHDLGDEERVASRLCMDRRAQPCGRGRAGSELDILSRCPPRSIHRARCVA